MLTFDRRTFARAIAGLALAPNHAVAALARSATEGERRSRARALRIDFLATPGPFNVPNDVGSPLTAEMLRNAATSGITGVNVSVAEDTLEATFRTIAYWDRELAAHPDVLVPVRTLRDLRAAQEVGKLGLIYGFQGTGVIGGDLDRLQLFSSFGVRVVQLTYNRRELVGDGCLEPANAGLSRLGAEAVERLNALRVVIDLAHGGQRTTAEAIRHSKVPVAISHSGCRAVANLPRNQRDEELRLLAERGGVVGIFLMPFLAMGRQPTADDVIRHIEHALGVCGEDHVGIGSDLSITPQVVTDEYRESHRRFITERKRLGIAAPGEEPGIFSFVPDLNSPRRLELIGERLRTRGHGSARIEKILGGNWLRLLRDVWGDA